MSRTCQFAFAGASGPAEWSFDEVTLIVAPANGRPLVFPVQELVGIAGDGFNLELTVPGAAAPVPTGETAGAAGAGASGETAGADALAGATPGREAAVHTDPSAPHLSLAKLGAEGPTLLEALQRCWLAARAKALRLGGSGEGKPFTGMVAEAGPGGAGVGGAAVRRADSSGPTAGGPTAGAAVRGGAAPNGVAPGGVAPGDPGAAEPFRAMLFEDVMVIAREGRDLDPLFIALTENITFDESTYSIRVTEWPGRELVFSRLAKQTQDFLDSLRRHREALANEAGALLASSVPSLPAAYRSLLAGDWPPGRVSTLQEMSATCPGFEQAFRGTWLAASVRQDEGRFLLDWAGAAGSWLGCSRETTDAGEGLLWLLAGKGDSWFLEALTGEDRATYRFAGDGEMPGLVARLLCAPQFSREALYGPPEMLTGDRADLAIAAQFLGFLTGLRARFTGRVIHSSLEGWRKEMEAAAS